MLDLMNMLVTDEGGATAVEYSLIAVFVSIAAVVAMQALGLELMDLFTGISSMLDYGLAKAGF